MPTRSREEESVYVRTAILEMLLCMFCVISTLSCSTQFPILYLKAFFPCFPPVWSIDWVHEKKSSMYLNKSRDSQFDVSKSVGHEARYWGLQRSPQSPWCGRCRTLFIGYQGWELQGQDIKSSRCRSCTLITEARSDWILENCLFGSKVDQ